MAKKQNKTWLNDKGYGLPFYKQLLDNLSEGVYFVDTSRRILYWNKGAERISGFSSKDVLGAHCFDNILLHVDLKGNSLCMGLCPLVKAIRSGKIIETEAFLRHKDGYRVPVLIKTTPVRDKKNKIVGAVEIFSENSARMTMREHIQQLEKLALLDPLTGLANRRYTEASVKTYLNQLNRYGWQFGVLFADIDNFKSVNDTFGHEIGDYVLKIVARTLEENSRSFDVIGRWGGEEFVILSQNIDRNMLSTIAERYRVLVESSAMKLPKGTLHVTISIGATMAGKKDTPKTLIKRADDLMYQSKKAGKNKVTIGP